MQTCAMCGVPESTVDYWRKQDWWKEQLKELQEQGTLKLSASLTTVMDKAMKAVEDRIENGEFVYNPRTGEIVRVPPKLRDIQKVATDSIDRNLLLTKVGKEKHDAKQAITADHLVMLAKEFAKFANGGREPEEAKDVTSIYEGEVTEVFDSLGIEVASTSGEQQHQHTQPT